MKAEVFFTMTVPSHPNDHLSTTTSSAGQIQQTSTESNHSKTCLQAQRIILLRYT